MVHKDGRMQLSVRKLGLFVVELLNVFLQNELGLPHEEIPQKRDLQTSVQVFLEKKIGREPKAHQSREDQVHPRDSDLNNDHQNCRSNQVEVNQNLQHDCSETSVGVLEEPHIEGPDFAFEVHSQNDHPKTHDEQLESERLVRHVVVVLEAAWTVLCVGMVGVVLKQSDHQYSVDYLEDHEDKARYGDDYCDCSAPGMGHIHHHSDHIQLLHNQIERDNHVAQQIPIDHLVEGVSPQVDSTQSSGYSESKPEKEGKELQPQNIGFEEELVGHPEVEDE